MRSTRFLLLTILVGAALSTGTFPASVHAANGAAGEGKEPTPASPESELAGASGQESLPPSAATAPQNSAVLVPLRVSVDPYFTIDTGADFTSSVVAALALGEEWIFSPLEDRRAAGMAARTARTLLFDLQVSFWFAILQHEAFGHDGRAREFGSSASFSMGSPWGFGRDASAGFDLDALDTKELLRVYAGGVQANSRAATLAERALVAGRPMRALDLLFLGWNRYATSAYILRTTPDPEDDPQGFFSEWKGGGDAARYLGYLNERFFGTPGITASGVDPSVLREWNRLERQAWWNLLDPGLWLALGATVSHVRNGDAPAPVSVPRLFGRRFLPVLSADWLIDGGSYSLETLFGPSPHRAPGEGPAWFSFVARYGEGPAGTFVAAGAATEKLWETSALRWGGEVEIWSGAETGSGGGMRLDARVRRGGLRDLFFEVGLKSDGPWPGRPAGVGPFARIGYRFDL